MIFGGTIEDLINQTRQNLGYATSGKKIKSKLEEVIERLIKRGYLIRSEEGNIQLEKEYNVRERAGLGWFSF